MSSRSAKAGEITREKLYRPGIIRAAAHFDDGGMLAHGLHPA
jgi:hypothetical protein